MCNSTKRYCADFLISAACIAETNFPLQQSKSGPTNTSARTHLLIERFIANSIVVPAWLDRVRGGWECHVII
jgi:hypothetical protein